MIRCHPRFYKNTVEAIIWNVHQCLTINGHVSQLSIKELELLIRDEERD